MPDQFLYDAFISYNQRLDKPFVRRLQRQLQHLGKAWWQRRAVRIFRDESSLSATPELWPSIERALTKSRYLIVCASPEAAASHWVHEEVQWWLQHRGQSALLIALTAGELRWDRVAGDFIWDERTPLPPAFKGAFATEPKWIDFRAYRALSESDRADEAFLGLAADLASTIRGIPKEDLLSEEVRQQRHALRTAYSAAGALAIVAAVAIWQGYRAYERGIETRRQRDAALLNQSQFVADLADNESEATRAALLQEVLPDRTSEDDITKTRPVWRVAEAKLNLAVDSSRERAVVNGHIAVYNRDATRILTGAHDGVVRLFDARTGVELARFRGHSEAILAVAFSQDETRVLTGSRDNTARLWDLQTGKELLRLVGHAKPVGSVAFKPDGTQVATGSADRTARLWDVHTGDEILRLSVEEGGVGLVAFSPDGTRILTGPGSVSATWDTSDGVRIMSDKVARVWDANTGKKLAELVGHERGITNIGFSLDGARIITASSDDTVRIWNAESLVEVTKLDGHSDGISCATLSPDGRRTATAGLDRTVRLWDTQTKAELARFNGHASFVQSLAFSSDGLRLLTSSVDNTVRVWDIQSAAEASQFNATLPQDDSLYYSVVEIAFSPDGSRMLTRYQTNPAVAKVTEVQTRIVRIWDVKARKPITQFGTGIRSAAFSPDGTSILTGYGSGTAIVWDLKSAKERIRLKGHTEDLLSVGFSPDGTKLITGSRDKSARVWDATSAANLAQLVGHTGIVGFVTFSPDGSKILTAPGYGDDSEDRIIRLWDAGTYKELKQIDANYPGYTGVAFSPDGKRIFVNVPFMGVRVMDVDSGRQLMLLRDRDGEYLRGMALSPDGKYLLRGGKLWDAMSGDILARVGNFDSAAFIPDSTGFVTSLDLNPGEVVILFSTNKSGQALIDYAKNRSSRCLTPGQRRKYYLPAQPPFWCIEMRRWPYTTQAWTDWLAEKRAGDSSNIPAEQD